MFLEEEISYTHPVETITMHSPGDDDEYEDDEGEGWDEIEDEDFEDMAEDRNDQYEASLEENEINPGDDDHLPEEEDF
jgi:hypothetical protein